MPPRPVHNPNATRISRTALAAGLLLLQPQRQGLHLRALQERHLQVLRGCNTMSLRQYALQHPHRYVVRASLGLFERGLFVHSCPARVRLIAAKNRLRIAFVGADRCRFVCRASPALPLALSATGQFTGKSNRPTASEWATMLLTSLCIAMSLCTLGRSCKMQVGSPRSRDGSQQPGEESNDGEDDEQDFYAATVDLAEEAILASCA